MKKYLLLCLLLGFVLTGCNEAVEQYMPVYLDAEDSLDNMIKDVQDKVETQE